MRYADRQRDPFRFCDGASQRSAEHTSGTFQKQKRQVSTSQRAGRTLKPPNRLVYWLKRRANAFVHAGRGITVLLGAPHGRIHLAATFVVTVVGLGLGISATDWALLLLCFAIVLASEAINTALERVVDIISPEWHPLARDAKDLAAGGVLIAAVVAVGVGAIVFLPYL